MELEGGCVTLVLLRKANPNEEPGTFAARFIDCMNRCIGLTRITHVVHEDACTSTVGFLSRAIQHGIPAEPRITDSVRDEHSWAKELAAELVREHMGGTVLVVARREALVHFVSTNMRPAPPDEVTDHWFRDPGSAMIAYTTPADAIGDPIPLDRSFRI